MTVSLCFHISPFSNDTYSLTEVFHRQKAGRGHGGGQGPQGPALFHPHPRNPALHLFHSYLLSLTLAPPSQQGHTSHVLFIGSFWVNAHGHCHQDCERHRDPAVGQTQPQTLASPAKTRRDPAIHEASARNASPLWPDPWKCWQKLAVCVDLLENLWAELRPGDWRIM